MQLVWLHIPFLRQVPNSDAEQRLPTIYAEFPGRFQGLETPRKLRIYSSRLLPVSDSLFCLFSPCQLCFAGLGADLQDACTGDSGGPLLRVPKTGQAVLVGVTSYGPEECGTEANLGAYTSIPRLRPWIDSQIKALKL